MNNDHKYTYLTTLFLENKLSAIEKEEYLEELLANNELRTELTIQRNMKQVLIQVEMRTRRVEFENKMIDTEDQKQKDKKVFEAQLRMAYDQIFKTKTEHRSSYPAYMYGSFNAIAAKDIPITRDTTKGAFQPAADPNQLITLGRKTLDPQSPPTFEVGTKLFYTIASPNFEKPIYFAIVEISEGEACFIAPDSNFENCTPNQCTLPKEYEIQITAGTFEVELLLSSNPFDFYPQETLSIAEYENWKTTHQDDIAIVITDMKYVGA